MFTPGFAILAVAFGLELAALTAFGIWGASLGPTSVSRAALGVGVSLLGAVFWGLFVSPKAAISLLPPYQLSLKLAVFTAATTALLDTGHPVVGTIFGIVAVPVTLGLYFSNLGTAPLA